MKKAASLLAIVLVLIFASALQAVGIFYVDVNSPNDPGSGSVDDPFRKIQDAIDDANDGDIIEIRPGLYTGSGNYDLDPNGKSIAIRSTDPNNPDVVANTIIDPNGAGRGFYFHNGEDANCMVSGFTIRNTFFNGDGGAVGCSGSSPTMQNCVISQSQARYGGGVGIINGGLLTLINCTIVKNSSYFNGGGIYCFDGNADIKNCIIRQNEVLYSSEGHQVGLEYQSSTSIAYTDIQDGQGGVSSAGSTLYWLSGNIESDPCFAAFDPNGDPNAWDLHLKSQFGRWKPSIYTDLDPSGDGFINLVDFAAFANLWQKQGSSIPADFDNSGLVDLDDLTLLLDNYLASYLPAEWVFDDVTSPCIDAGDPNSDYSAEPWPNGKRINMGAYGGTNQASKNGNIADFDVSGAVNFEDFAALAGKWMDEGELIEDLNVNGVIDYDDVGVFSENWLWQKN